MLAGAKRNPSLPEDETGEAASDHRERQGRRPRHRSLPPGCAGGANGEVSWLRAPALAFPGSTQWRGERWWYSCPLQWRGRAGVAPDFRASLFANDDQLY